MFLIRWLPDRWKERLRQRAGAITLRDRLENLRRAGFTPRQVIDAGAYHGAWARTALEVFPVAELLMIEPQPALAPRLSRLCAETSHLRFRSTLLGAEKHRAKFLLGETNSRVVSDSYVAGAGEHICELEVETLEAVAQAEGFTQCDLLKLDLQGHELPALAGAGGLFGEVEVIVMEVSWLPIGGGPLIHEVSELFHHRGYQLYDILGFNYRPLDRALWQTDVIFVHRNSALLAQEGRWQ
jgi:FkbM family methyltransferase